MVRNESTTQQNEKAVGTPTHLRAKMQSHLEDRRYWTILGDRESVKSAIGVTCMDTPQENFQQSSCRETRELA